MWFNNLVASAGGTDRQRRRASPTLDAAAVKAAQIIKDVATSGRADPSLSTAQEDQGRLAFEAGQGRLHAQLALRLRRRARGRQDQPGDQEGLREHGLRAASRRVNPGEPSKVSIGGANIGVSKTGKQPGARDQGRALHDQREVAEPGGHQRGPAAGHEQASYDDPEVRKVYPFADLLREQLKDAVPARDADRTPT